MDSLPSSSLLFKSFLISLVSFSVPSFSADPDPLQDFCVADLNSSVLINGFPCKSNVTSEDFVFGNLFRELNTSNPDGVGFTTADVTTFPALNTLGVTIANIELAPGGLTTPHVHPRATELVIITEGSVLAGFVSTDNTFYSKVVRRGDIFVIPRGLVHFQFNNGKIRASEIAVLNSQNPGFAFIPNNLFGSNPTIPNEVLTAAFRTDNSTINMIKSMFATQMRFYSDV